MVPDVRWIQRLNNFQNAMKNLQEGVEEAAGRDLNKLEKQGVIQAFEFCYKLAWNTVKDFYEAQGDTGIQGSRDAFTLAFNRGLIREHGTALIESIRSRQLSTHTYDEETANGIFGDIVNKYFAAFRELLQCLEREKKRYGMTGLDKETEKKIRSVLTSFEAVDKAVLYGSRAKGNYKNGSDIDLTLFGGNLTRETIYKIHDALDELYLPYRFDLSIFGNIKNSDLKEHIERVSKVFFERGRGDEDACFRD